jgi:type IV pilus assembly protein PilW
MSRPALRRPRGFSIVELMVSLTIGLILMTLLAIVFSNASRAQKEITASGQQIENGRYAIDLLSDDARHAGFYGYFSSPGTPPATAPDPCSIVTATLSEGLTLPVYGYNSPSTSPLSCIDSANLVANTDILVVRRAATKTTAVASLDTKLFYIQGVQGTSVSGNPKLDLGANPSTFTLTVRNGTGSSVQAPIWQYTTHIYFVAPCSNPSGSGGTVCTSADDGGSPIPTLKRLELTKDASNNTAMVTYPLVEGIENFQVEYGLDTDADGSPNSSAYSVDPGATSNWRNVMALRLYVLARNTQTSQGYTDSKTYALGGTSVTPGGNYRRHVYQAIVRVKNPSERRESP